MGLSDYWIHRTATLANLALLTLLAATLAELTWRVLPAPQGAESVALTTAAVTTESQRQSDDRSERIASLHLFGKEEEVAQRAPAPEEMPETQLELTLRGVLAAQSPRLARAIIANSAGREDFYAVGAELPGDAILEEIHPEHVVLSRNNRYETLRLPDNALIPRARETADTTVQAGGQTAQNPSALLREYQQRLAEDPQSLSEVIQGEPVRRGGRLVGFRLRPSGQDNVLRQFGLRSGDIVTAVNGMRLDDPRDSMEALRNLATADQVSLDVMRDGVHRSFNFNLQQE